MAATLQRRGDLAASLDVLDAALARNGSDATLHFLRAAAWRAGGRDVDAERDFRAALAADSGHIDAALALAFLLREQGRIDAACATIAALWKMRQDDAAVASAALGFLRECGDLVRAREIAFAAIARWPGDARLAAIAGDAALALGDFADAERELRRAVALDPEQSAAWLRLSHCRRYADAADPDLRRFAAISADARRTAQTRICAGFALGKAYDDLGDFAGAAAALRTANALARSGSPWQSARWDAEVERQLAYRLPPAAAGADDFSPLFIVGLPRTGTTLAATLLARHPDVRDRGELNWISALAADLDTAGRLANPAALRAAARLVTAQMRRDDAPARWYVDKNPLNFRHLGFIATLFPRARIVHCRRGLRDTALSIWMQHFAHGDMAFAYDFAAIAHVARSEAALMTHWRSSLALPVFDLEYESLIADRDAALTRLADFLGISAAPLLSDAPPAASAIATASVWQARQPLYTRSVGRWRRYAPFVPELREQFNGI